MKNMSVGKKITFGFGVVLILLAVVGVMSFTGVSDIVKDAHEVIIGNELDRELAQKEVDHLNWVNKVNAFLNNESIAKLEVEVDDHKCAFGKWLYGEERKETEKLFADIAPLLREIEGPHHQLHKSAVDLGKAKSKAEARTIYVNQTGQSLEKVQGLLKKIRETAKKHVMTEDAMLKDAASTKRNVTIVGIIAIVIGTFFAWTIARGITKVLKGVSTQLGDAAEQVASASTQVSSASQSLAEGASEQAAGLEETSSSIEEMASMTKQNADNANQANTLMTETSRVVNDANRSMGELTESMKEISQASEETAKIIKTIDEIAFQTNLLALNAAVEAARAGEAGAGFAVVADEVRNLAMRAADAAKNTANLIEGTVKKIKNGSDTVAKTNEAFGKVASGAKKVGELVGEIAAASQEQAQGIDQVNKAVAEMDKTVQKNAASAEESASASEEMNAQAEQMKGFVAELVAMVGGGNGNG
ncbi:MAG: methyl-accepting chemotaxis protein, partial [Deltaproteobacteria bacterium]|nr:methyl-accepting chemotaxis protein [Deltaproteobacteria bacterium]